MAVLKSDLKFYLTGSEPGVAQANPANSVGGYMSPTAISSSSLLSTLLTSDSTDIDLASSLSGLASIDNEIVQITGASVDRALLATTSLPHAAGSIVYAPPVIFNNDFNTNLSQYRCIAVYNSNTISSFFALKFYLKQLSRNPDVNIKFAVECPKTPTLATTATSATTLSISDSTQSGNFADNYFLNCAIQFTSGINVGLSRIIQSYDGATGTFVLKNSVVTASSAGDTFVVLPAPSQRTESGTIAPTVNSSNVSAWISDTTLQSIDVGGFRTGLLGSGGPDLGPRSVIYLWFARNTSENASAFSDNSIIFTSNYRTQ